MFGHNVFSEIINKDMAIIPTFSKGIFYETSHKGLTEDRQTETGTEREREHCHTEEKGTCILKNIFKQLLAVNL